MKPTNPEQEHSCSCCENPEVVEKLLSLQTPPVICDGVVKIADSQRNYQLGQLKERADRLNNITTSEKRVAELVRKGLEDLGHTRSSR